MAEPQKSFFSSVGASWFIIAFFGYLAIKNFGAFAQTGQLSPLFLGLCLTLFAVNRFFFPKPLFSMLAPITEKLNAQTKLASVSLPLAAIVCLVFALMVR